MRIFNDVPDEFDEEIKLILTKRELQLIYDTMMNISYNDATQDYSNKDGYGEYAKPVYSLLFFNDFLINLESIMKNDSIFHLCNY